MEGEGGARNSLRANSWCFSMGGWTDEGALDHRGNAHRRSFLICDLRALQEVDLWPVLVFFPFLLL